MYAPAPGTACFREPVSNEVTMDNIYQETTATDTVKQYKDGIMTDVDATVVSECHFAIFLNDSYYAGMTKKKSFIDAMEGHCLVYTDLTPEYLNEFAIGYSYCNGEVIPERLSEVKMVEADEENIVSIVFVDGLMMKPRGGYVDHQIAYSTRHNLNIALSPQKILEEMKRFTERSETFKTTGAMHAAEIYDGNACIKYIEDLNKAHAIYKVIGYSLMHGIDLSGCAMFSTGRVFKENVHACEMTGCHMLISKSPPTRQAIEYAMEKDITLIGFARGDSFKVYCGEERIIL